MGAFPTCLGVKNTYFSGRSAANTYFLPKKVKNTYFWEDNTTSSVVANTFLASPNTTCTDY